MARSLSLAPQTTIVMKGHLLRIGEVFDEFWIRSKDLLDLPEIVARLRTLPGRPDILTSVQKLPHVTPQFSYYYEWDNLAVANFESHSAWFETQIDRSARKQIRQSAKAGLRTEIVPFNDDLVKGICSIYNELPVRQGRKFWHYGKDQETVKAENATYLERSVFIGAFYENELIGFLKIVLDGEVASLMQILSKAAHFHRRPNNALLSKAVEACEREGARSLTYGQYIYGKKGQSSLAEFKDSHGFKRVDIPRYYIPLTLRGRVALKCRLHKGLASWMPASAGSLIVKLRARYYQIRRNPR